LNRAVLLSVGILAIVAVALAFFWTRGLGGSDSDVGQLRIERDQIRNDTWVSIYAGQLAASEIGSEPVPMSLSAGYTCDGTSPHCTPQFITLSIDCTSRELQRTHDGTLVLDGTRFPILNGLPGVPPVWWSPHAIRLVIHPGELDMMVNGAKDVRGIVGDVAFQLGDDNLKALRKLSAEQFPSSTAK
jgi:hypothetical protein